MVCNMLQNYGEVYKSQYYYRKYGRYNQYRISGFRIAWLKLNKTIPQSLFLNQTKSTIYVQYPNQQMTCNRCGTSGHRVDPVINSEKIT